MKNKVEKGLSKLPRINFEVKPEFKQAVNKKCRIEGISIRMAGILLFKEWLTIPAVPEGKINVN